MNPKSEVLETDPVDLEFIPPTFHKYLKGLILVSLRRKSLTIVRARSETKQRIMSKHDRNSYTLLSLFVEQVLLEPHRHEQVHAP